jgi:hypothetical protein
MELEARMTYRVVNFTTQEIRAELSDVKDAVAMADMLAADCNHQEDYGVVKLITIYQTRKGEQAP